ncbi:VOC family protein [Novosphingobium sp. JCM 18896]|uniref:VOC family protein n=1 Tax=Novosphingobium sp. JCM 18896 TaxID=2989731 RepID=UPI002222BC35|nr:VOC family protein [Novosphingobium sp. JCM 18896]MCW1431749.1 VOC family protein [Novosphingobium sp. JCM 18896]
MIIHVCFGTRDLEKAGTFYDAIAEALGAARSHATDTAIYWSKPGTGIGFAATLPYNGEPATWGNGVMATLGAENAAMVDRVHAAALANGGTDEGAPGPRANGMYCAYWRDPDGNKMNAVALG